VISQPLTLKIDPPCPGTWQEFRSWFADELACATYLEQLRWATGFRCPKCGCAKGWRIADGRWSCSGCARKVSVTAGTVFDRSRIPLQEWFASAWYMTSQRHGVSTLGLQRLLGLGSYQTAWTILQRLRTALILPGRDRLCGPVEVDENHVGSIVQGARDGGADCGFIVLIAIEVLSPNELGRVSLQRVQDVSGDSVGAFVSATIEPGAEVRTGGGKGYKRLASQGYIHKPADISEFRGPASPSMPGVRSVAALLKRWLLGTHHGLLTGENLDAYLNEFAFRFNHRHSRGRGLLFQRLLQNAVVTPPTRYRPSRSQA